MNSENHPAKITSFLLMIALITAAFSLFQTTSTAYAKNNKNEVPPLRNFIETITNGEADTLRGVYISMVMALPIIQQPDGNSKFISENNSTATQFNMAAREGNVGLLAHNYLAGGFFFDIQNGDEIILIFGNGRTEIFIVEGINQYEALPYGVYRDTNTQDLISTGALFSIMYDGEYHVTLQTCIENNGNLNWGRLFITAKPAGSLSIAPPPPPPAASRQHIAPFGLNTHQSVLFY